jgi:hypothetical protein
MAVLRSGILGRASGKVAGVVGAHWKDRSYVREYVIPANPNTAPQQAQRLKMKRAVAAFKTLVGPVFNVYVDKFNKGMSGFNRIVSQNIHLFVTALVTNTMKITLGKLWPPALFNTSSAGLTITITWYANSFGNNGAATDKVYACCFNGVTGLWHFAAAEVLRSAGTIDIPAAGSMAGQNCICYIWASKYSIASPTLLEMVSDSVGVDVLTVA